MIRLMALAILPATAALAQAVPVPVPSIDAARAAARAVDQSIQPERTGQESLDRTTPLLKVEPHKDPSKATEAEWRKAKEAEAKQALEKPLEKPKD